MGRKREEAQQDHNMTRAWGKGTRGKAATSLSTRQEPVKKGKAKRPPIGNTE